MLRPAPPLHFVFKLGIVALALLFASEFVSAQARDQLTFAVSLSADDMSLIVALRPSEEREQMASDEKARREFARHLRELFSVAEEARLGGLADRPDLNRQLAWLRTLAIAGAYFRLPKSSVSDAAVKQLFTDPEQERIFQQVLTDNQAKHPRMTTAEIRDLRNQFAVAVIGERRGIAAGVDKQRNVELQILFQRAQLVASTYAEETLLPRIHLSEAEIDDYMVKHATDGLTRDQARDAVQLGKEKSALDEITKRRAKDVFVPDNFTVVPLTTMPMTQSPQ